MKYDIRFEHLPQWKDKDQVYEVNVWIDCSEVIMPYDGTPEIKEQGGNKYLYIRKRIAGKLTSAYVDVYSDELYQLLLRNAKEARELNKNIRRINKKLSLNKWNSLKYGKRDI